MFWLIPLASTVSLVVGKVWGAKVATTETTGRVYNNLSGYKPGEGPFTEGRVVTPLSKETDLDNALCSIGERVVALRPLLAKSYWMTNSEGESLYSLAEGIAAEWSTPSFEAMARLVVRYLAEFPAARTKG